MYYITSYKNILKKEKHFKKKISLSYNVNVTNLSGSIVSNSFHTDRDTPRPNKFWDLSEKSEDYRQRILRPIEKHRTLEDFGGDEEAYEL